MTSLEASTEIRTMRLTREQLLAYRARWQLVKEFEIAELRAATFEMRWRQLNAVLNMAATLGWFPAEHSDEQVDIARRRWTRLKELADEHTSGISQSGGRGSGHS